MFNTVFNRNVSFQQTPQFISNIKNQQQNNKWYLKVLSFLHAHTLLEHANIYYFLKKEPHLRCQWYAETENGSLGCLVADWSRLGHMYVSFDAIQRPHSCKKVQIYIYIFSIFCQIDKSFKIMNLSAEECVPVFDKNNHFDIKD